MTYDPHEAYIKNVLESQAPHLVLRPQDRLLVEHFLVHRKNMTADEARKFVDEIQTYVERLR